MDIVYKLESMKINKLLLTGQRNVTRLLLVVNLVILSGLAMYNSILNELPWH